MQNNQKVRWPDIINEIQSKGKVSQQQTELQNLLRKKQYKQLLENQIKSKDQNKKNESQKTKRQQYQQMIQQIQRGRDLEVKKRNQKRGLQKYYQAENHQLLVSNNERSKSNKTNRLQNGRNSQAFTDKILNDWDNRRKQTASNFQLQNYLNQIQSQIRQKTVNDEKKKSLQNSMAYNIHVEKQFDHKNQERELWKNKYLRNKSERLYEKIDDKSAYRKYLDLQAMEKNQQKKRTRYEQVDERLTAFNKRPENANSSPAYLGKVNLTTDRRHQLDILNRHLRINYPRKIQSLLPQPQNVHKSQTQDSHSQAKILRNQNSVKSDSSFSEINSQLNSMANNQKFQNRKQYVSYDFIAGNKKLVFL